MIRSPDTMGHSKYERISAEIVVMFLQKYPSESQENSLSLEETLNSEY